MLDHRVYRAAFLPALVAMFVVAFSLGDRPAAHTTRIAPDAFDPARAFGSGRTPPPGSLRALADAFGDRRPGSAGDRGLARRVARELVRSRFATPADVRRHSLEAETIDGDATLEAVTAVREGLSSRAILVVAHRDAFGAPALAELSGTAALLELARVFAEGDLPRTLVLASVSGGSGGLEGARQLAERLDRPFDAVVVLGDLASEHVHKPFVVPWSTGGPPAPHGLRRTVEAALRTETGADPGGARAPGQWARRAFSLTVSEQGPLNEAGLPAVLVSASGEVGPEADAPVDVRVFQAMGRGVLRAIRALEAAPVPPPAEAARPLFQGGEGVVTMRRLLPDWSVRLLVGTLLLPALVAALDGFFRARRRRVPAGRWLLWAAAWSVPFLLAWLWLRLLDLLDAVRALPVPVPPAALGLTPARGLAMASVLLVLGFGWLVLRGLVRPALAVRRPGAGGAAGLGVVLALLVAGVWVANPYAAAALLPAAHAWLLVAAAASPPRRAVAAGAVLAGLALPALVAFYYADALRLGALDFLWVAFQAGAGGTVDVVRALVLSLFAGSLCALAAVLRDRGSAAAAAPEDVIVTRGPRGYAGPGSLGGTESALRR